MSRFLKRTQRPIDDKENGSLADRAKLILGDESVLSFSKRAGVSEGMIRSLLDGGMPRIDNLLLVAEAAGVSFNWLATGEGPMRKEDFQSGDDTREDLALSFAGDKAADARLDEKREATTRTFGEMNAAAKALVQRALKGRNVSMADEQELLSLAFYLIRTSADLANNDIFQPVVDAICRGYDAQNRLERIGRFVWEGKDL